MKLAEALIERKGLQKKIERLSERLVNNAKTQEGETPSENPLELIKEINGTNEELTHLIIEINKTNALVYLNPAQMPVVTLADALAKRDGIAKKRNILAKFAEAATEPVRAYGRLEVKYIRTMNIPAIQKEIDALAAEYNALDAKIQGKNWEIDLVVD